MSMSNGLVSYLTIQIMKDKIDYNKVVAKYPGLQEGIDKALEKNGVLEKYKK